MAGCGPWLALGIYPSGIAHLFLPTPLILGPPRGIIDKDASSFLNAGSSTWLDDRNGRELHNCRGPFLKDCPAASDPPALVSSHPYSRIVLDTNRRCPERIYSAKGSRRN